MAYPFRPSSLKERKQFYQEEFNLNKVKAWFRKNNLKLPQICAIDAGSETGIIANKKLKGFMLYFPFSELKTKIKKYIPEDIYYNRNFYKSPSNALKKLNFKNWLTQELIFDIDADNISCVHLKKQQVCKKCLRKAFFWTEKLDRTLKTKFNFKKTAIVYSGRGFHIHVLDKKSFSLSIEQRQSLTKQLEKFPIDPWVSRGYINLVRLPYSLNALVSRKVIPTTKKLDDKITIPKFLKS